MSVPSLNPGGPLVIRPYADQSGGAAGGVLVVAAGTKTGTVVTARNAMRVLDDGTILIQRSGDIGMGEFAAGPQP